MRYLAIFMLVLTVAPVVVGATITPSQVQRLIDRVGPATAVERIFADESKADTVLRGISSGTEDWLRVAVALAPGLDAHPREAVESALAAALKSHPAQVLRIATNTFGVDGICSGPDVDDYEHLAPALAELRARQSSVNKMNAPDLSRLRKQCLKGLAASEKPLRAFFINP